MQRALSIVSALAMVVLSAVLAFKSAAQGPALAPLGAFADAATPAMDAGTDAAPIERADELAPVHLELPDAGVASAPGAGTPRHVRFGVVLVAYAGSEGAPDKARSKHEALTLATRLAEDAKTDFHGAAQRGDSGSSDDVGTVTRGVLEPALEAALFTLPVGQVSDPVDTPRGFWIVKRLE